MPKSLFGKMGLVLIVQSLISAVAMIYFLRIMIDDPATLGTVVQVVLACLSVSLVIGLLFFRPLSRRVRKLAQVVSDYQASNFSAPVQLLATNPTGDEIDRLVGGVTDARSTSIAAGIGAALAAFVGRATAEVTAALGRQIRQTA